MKPIPSIRSRLRNLRAAARACSGVLAAGLALAGGAAAQPVNITSQSGISYTGSVSATALGDVIGMTANSAFPSSTTIGTFAFRGIITVGTDLWLLPTDSDEIVAVNSTTGTMTGYPLIGVGTTLNKFVGGVFDGTFIWLVPFNGNAVLRVRVADGGGGSKGDVVLFDLFPAGISSGDAGKFAGGVFAGGFVWMVPHNADRVVRLDPADGTMVGFNGWPGTFTKGAAAFWGGVFDGTRIWMVPFDADRVVKVDPSDGSMTEVAASRWTSDLTSFTLPSRAFAGGTWDGSRIWLSPYDADRVVSIATATDAMTGYGTVNDATQWPAGYAKSAAGSFNGAIFDGASVWLVPFEDTRVVKVNATSGAILTYGNFPSGVVASDLDKFAGAGFDGTDIYFGPATRSGRTLVKLFTTATPVVSSVNRLTPADAPTNADSVVFRVTFNKNVAGVDTSDFALTTTGTVAASIASVSAATGTTIDVTVNTDTGDGTLRLDVNASGTGITDDFANPLSGGFSSGQTYTIDNIAPVITSASAASGTYKAAFSYTITASGAPVGFGATGLPDGLSVNTGTGAVTGAPTAAGVSSVTISATDAAGNVGSTVLTLTIATAPLTVSGITAADKTYDGTTAAALNASGATLNGVEPGDVVSLNTSGATGAFAAPGVGTGITVTISGLTLGGAQAANYTLSPATTTAMIESRTLTVSGVTAADRGYDGTTAAALGFGGASLVNVIGGDTVALVTGSAVGVFADKNAGVAKPVTISGLAISGASAGNYTLTQPSATATITPKPLTVTGVTAVDRVYDGTTAATLNTSGAALVGIETGDGVTLAAGSASASFGTAAVGAGKPVTITGLGLSGPDAANYTLTQPAATASITAKGLTVAGVTANDKVYDGTTAATLSTAGASLVGVVAGDTVALDAGAASATFADALVGAGKTVTVSGLALSGAAAGNYTLTQPAATASITAKALTVSGITAANKVFDGATTATINASGASLVGVVGSDVVTLNTASVSGAFATAAVGSGKTVTISGLAIAGAAAGNYTLTQPTATANITAASASIVLGATSQPFNDAPRPVSVTTTPSGLATVVTYDGDTVVPSAIGSYVVVATITDPNYTGSVSGTLTITATSSLVNVAARSRVTLGDDILISGFVVSGSSPKPMLVRGVGPRLFAFDVAGHLVAPRLTLFRGGDVLATNTGWSSASNAAQIETTTADLGAFPLPAGSADCAILMTLEPGAYTVHLSGVADTQGVGLVEVYDADPSSAGARLVNVSARANVGVGDDILIPGFVIEPAGARKVLIRVLGPRLGAAGVAGTLADPRVRLFLGPAELHANDDWGTESNAAEIASLSAQLGALAFTSGSKDAALLVTLEPGAYTVQVSGVGDTGGIVLVELFEIE